MEWFFDPATGDVTLETATGLLLTECGDLVLLKLKGRNDWVLPGGVKDKGETPLQTLLREMEEETGLIDFTVLNDGEPVFIRTGDKDGRDPLCGTPLTDEVLRAYPEFRGKFIFGSPDHVYLLEGRGVFSPRDTDEVKDIQAFDIDHLPTIGRSHPPYVGLLRTRYRHLVLERKARCKVS